jgi:hypothetical protein
MDNQIAGGSPTGGFVVCISCQLICRLRCGLQCSGREDTWRSHPSGANICSGAHRPHPAGKNQRSHSVGRNDILGRLAPRSSATEPTRSVSGKPMLSRRLIAKPIKEAIMSAISKVVSLLAISAALTLSGSHVFAKSAGGPAHPSQVQASGTSAAPAGAGDSESKRRGGYGCGHACPAPPRPGHTQPTCKGPHRGPNGVMIQCD